MSNVNVNRAIAMALAGNYKIGGDGEMMIQETLWEGLLSNIGDEGTLSKSIDYYDLILIECNTTPPNDTTIWNNIILPSQNGVLTDINDNYGDSIYLYISFPNKNTVHLNYKLSKVFTNGAVTKVIGIKFTGTKSIDYSTEEQVIGKWIDGKPLYQRVLSFEDKPSVSNWAPLFDDTYYDQLVECKEIIKTGNNSYCYYSDASTIPRYGIIEHKICYYHTSTLSGRKLVIQYTKTTD